MVEDLGDLRRAYGQDRGSFNRQGREEEGDSFGADPKSLRQREGEGVGMTDEDLIKIRQCSDSQLLVLWSLQDDNDDLEFVEHVYSEVSHRHLDLAAQVLMRDPESRKIQVL